MKKKLKIGRDNCILLCKVALFLLCGCSSLDYPKNDLMEDGLPQRFLFKYPIKSVWEAVSDEQKKIFDAIVLTVSQEDFILSWITQVHRKNKQHSALKDVNLIRKSRKKVPAITSIWLKADEKSPNMCWLYIRQIYYPVNSKYGVSHSRGNYESYFVKQLLSRLESL